jgi:excisionase family DNA binding protein
MTVDTQTRLCEVLDRHGTGLAPADVIAGLDAALSRAPKAGSAPLAAAELAFLRENGGPQAAGVIDSWDPAVQSRRDAEAVIARLARDTASSMSIAEAAATLGVDRSRISHRLAGGTLWAYTVGGARRIPRWQFTAKGVLLPGLRDVVAAIPEGITPPTVEAFMRSPLPELGGAAPVGYLADGGDPGVVAASLAALGEW